MTSIIIWILPSMETEAQRKQNLEKTIGLNLIEAKGKLKVEINKKITAILHRADLSLCDARRSLTHSCHLQSLRKTLTSIVALLRRLTVTSWGLVSTFCVRKLSLRCILLLSTALQLGDATPIPILLTFKSTMHYELLVVA